MPVWCLQLEICCYIRLGRHSVLYSVVSVSHLSNRRNDNLPDFLQDRFCSVQLQNQKLHSKCPWDIITICFSQVTHFFQCLAPAGCYQQVAPGRYGAAGSGFTAVLTACRWKDDLENTARKLRKLLNLNKNPKPKPNQQTSQPPTHTSKPNTYSKSSSDDF